MGKPQAQPPALALKGISKRFGATAALSDVSLTIEQGTIHGLLGENGSGKSTLIKVLSGFHVPDSGTLEVSGNAVAFPLHPGAPRELGIDFVHQDLGLVPTLTVAENFVIGDLVNGSRRGYISWRTERRRVQHILDEYGARIDAGVVVSELGAVQRAMLAIVRAVHGLVVNRPSESCRGVLVLDEPTVFLPPSGVEELFALSRGLVARGASVLFVSHDLDEVLGFTDAVTVLRDGRVTASSATSAITRDRLIEQIVGRSLSLFENRRSGVTPTAPAVHIERVRTRWLHDVSLDLASGEIVGLTGVAGSGFEELPYALFGSRSVTHGQLHIDGAQIDLSTLDPTTAVRAGIALIPGDRLGEGSVGQLSAVDNATLLALDDYFGHFALKRRAMVSETDALLADYDVRPLRPMLPYASFSGGNQQKILLAKWFRVGPRLLLMHEPTQGVDIGARQQIFRFARKAADEGAAVVCASSDHEQLAMICDRVAIFSAGRIATELEGERLTREAIGRECYVEAERASEVA